MEELLALLERYSPGYRETIHGVFDWRLDELEEEFGRPLPTFYKSFATTMGQQGGPLLAHVNVREPLHIAFLYESIAGEMPPRRFLFIFGDPDPLAPYHYWLDLEAPSEEGDGQVVRMPFGENAWIDKLHRDFISLREMLFLWAMEAVHLPSFPYQARYHRGKGPKAGTAEDLARLLEKTGFNRLPYPRHSMLFEREDAAIRLYRLPDDSTFDIRVGMHSAEQLSHFQALIEDNSDLERSRW
ncbi:hypothetical protein ACN469_04195 [Corallococcus terminator]